MSNHSVNELGSISFSKNVSEETWLRKGLPYTAITNFNVSYGKYRRRDM